jgi:hypothetical protein
VYRGGLGSSGCKYKVQIIAVFLKDMNNGVDLSRPRVGACLVDQLFHDCRKSAMIPEPCESSAGWLGYAELLMVPKK